VAATTAKRIALAADASNTPVPHFDYGTARSSYEARWTRERYAVLTQILAAAPVVWRHFLKHKIFDAFDAWEADGRLQPGGQPIHEIFREVAAKYPQRAA
jgi:N-methylhydantoinase B